MFKPIKMTFEQLSEGLREYEIRHGFSTIDFYRRYQNGELGDDDEYMLWAGLYHLYLTSMPVRQFMNSDPLAG